MSRTYHSYAELKDNALREDDILNFHTKDFTLSHKVIHNYLYGRDGNFDEIFRQLKLEKRSFCRKAYGYSCDNGNFPTSKNNDFAALKRLALALFKECESRDNKYPATYDESIKLETHEEVYNLLYSKFGKINFLGDRILAIKTEDENECSEVQNVLFSYGFKWNNGPGVKHLNAKHLSIRRDGRIFYSSNGARKYSLDSKTFLSLIPLNSKLYPKDILNRIKTTNSKQTKQKNNGKIAIIRKGNLSIARGKRPTGKTICDPRVKPPIAVRHKRYREKAISA